MIILNVLMRMSLGRVIIEGVQLLWRSLIDYLRRGIVK